MEEWGRGKIRSHPSLNQEKKVKDSCDGQIGEIGERGVCALYEGTGNGLTLLVVVDPSPLAKKKNRFMGRE